MRQSSGSVINVGIAGTLNFGDATNSGQYSTVQLTNAAANILVGGGGAINFYQTNTELINRTVAGAVISNSGMVSLVGVNGAGPVSTSIDVPLQNHSTFNVSGGEWTFGVNDGNNNDLSMDGGSINMSGDATIKCAHQFTQTGGVFNITDAQEGFFVVGGAANFNGGAVNFTNPSGFGTLNTYDIVFNGATVNMVINANTSESDLITDAASGLSSVTIKGNSTINVTLNGTTMLASDWTLIESANAISGDFQTVNLPTYIFELPVSNVWSCQYLE